MKSVCSKTHNTFSNITTKISGEQLKLWVSPLHS